MENHRLASKQTVCMLPFAIVPVVKLCVVYELIILEYKLEAAIPLPGKIQWKRALNASDLPQMFGWLTKHWKL